MGGTEYLEKIVLPGGTWVYGVAADPNGATTAPVGTLALAADGSGPWENTNSGTVWKNLAASMAIGAYPSNVYTVDTTLAAANPFLRAYPTITAALAAGDAGLVDFSIDILPNQVHLLPAVIPLTKNVTIRCPYGGRSGVVATAGATGVSGTLGSGKTLRFSNVTVGQVAALIDTTGEDTLVVDDCRYVALGGQQIIGFAGVQSTGDTQWIGARFVSIGQNVAIGFIWSNSTWTPGAGFPAGATVFGMSGSVVNTFIDCDVDAESIDDVTVWSRSLNNPVVHLKGTDVAVENTGAGTSTLFSSASLGVRLDNVGVTRSGAGLVAFGNGVVSPFAGLSWHGTDPSDVLPSGTWHNVAGAITEVP